MKVINYTLNDKAPYDLSCIAPPDKIFFFDIETTGLSPSRCMIYMIGVMYYDVEFKKFRIRQWFLDNAADEKLMLEEFADFCDKFKYVIHFNGSNFDIPFIEKHCEFYDIDFSFEQFKSIDLYKVISPYKKVLELNNVKQKTLEEFVGIHREDKYDGGKLIKVYKDYLLKKATENEEILTLHNYEDVKNMLALTSLLTVLDLFTGNFKITNCNFTDCLFCDIDTTSKKSAVSFTLEFANPFPNDLYIEKGAYKFNIIDSNIAVINIAVISSTLKHFFANYKDYFYLPLEDYAIHKSLGDFVDRKNREKAKKDNCYIKLTSSFVPCPKRKSTTNYALNRLSVFKESLDGKAFYDLKEIKGRDCIYDYVEACIKSLK